MLKKIIIKNFQKHRKRILTFDRVTTIVGKSDAGKSSVARAFQWLVLNKPPRGTFIRGRGPASVTLKLGKHVIVRKQGKGVNLYRLNGKRYVSFGKGKVPEDITNVLNLGTANFQRQGDLHFWFSDTPGQVSKNLNQIINLGVIDNALENAAKEVRRSKVVVAVSAERLSQARGQKQILAWVPDFCTAADAVEAARLHREELGLRCSQLQNLASGLNRAALTRDSTLAALLAGKAALVPGALAVRLGARVGALRRLVRDVGRAKAKAATPAPDIAPLLEERVRGDAVAEKRRALEGLIEDIKQKKEKLCLVKISLKANLKTLQRRGKGRCPTCGRLLSRTRTSPTDHPCSAPRRKTGTKSKQDM